MKLVGGTGLKSVQYLGKQNMYSSRLIKYIAKAHSALIDNYRNAPTNFGSYLNRMQRSAICP